MPALVARVRARTKIDEAFEWYRVRFPYAVYFKQYPRPISVVGVIHGNRHPDNWLARAAP